MRTFLLGSAGLAGLLFSATALAQTQGDQQMETIVVTGIKLSNLNAINRKLESDGISDVISSNEVQALPDLTIVEALRRIPGIAVLPSTDNEHPRDESATPVLRGLGPNYNNVTIDGMQLASPGTPNANLGSNSRGVRLDLIPSSMISEMRVVKTFTADLDPNAIGGAIDMRTRSAFDHGGDTFFTADAALGTADDVGVPNQQDRLGLRFVSTGSLTFGSANQFGLVISANYQKLETYTDTHMTTDTVHYLFYDDSGKSLSGTNIGNGWAVPQQDKYWYVQNARERSGLTGKLEGDFSDKLYVFATLGHYRFRDTMVRNEVILDARSRGTVLNQTATSGSYPAGDVEVGWSWQNMTNVTDMALTGADWRIDDHQTLKLHGGVSWATYREPIKMIKYVAGTTYNAPGKAASIVPTANYAFTYDTDELNASFDMSPSAYYALDNYKAYYFRPDYKRSAGNKIQTVRLDYTNNSERSDRGFGFELGAAFTRSSVYYDVYRHEYNPNTALASPLTLSSVLGRSGAPLRYSNNHLNLLTINPEAAWAQFYTHDLREFTDTDQSTFNNQDAFDLEELSGDAYVTVTYTGERLRTIVGLHYDTADIDATGRAKIAGTWKDMPTTSGYHFWLPSLLSTYQITSDVDIRFGASQTIGRPSYESYVSRSSIKFVNMADYGNGNATDVTVTVGNPSIKPRLSTNLDLAFDWRLDARDGGLISIALFSKNIEDEIFDSSSIGYTYEGVNYVNASVRKPVNATSAYVRGAEFSVIFNSLEQLHPVLEPVGFSVNYSLMKGRVNVLQSDGSVRKLGGLVGQPDRILNVALFYSAGDFEARVAYNSKGTAIRSIVPNIFWQDMYWSPRDQVDAQVSYKFGAGISIFGQISNLTHSRITSLTGVKHQYLKDTYSVPSVLWVGLRYTPDL